MVKRWTGGTCTAPTILNLGRSRRPVSNYMPQLLQHNLKYNGAYLGHFPASDP